MRIGEWVCLRYRHHEHRRCRRCDIHTFLQRKVLLRTRENSHIQRMCVYVFIFNHTSVDDQFVHTHKHKHESDQKKAFSLWLRKLNISIASSDQLKNNAHRDALTNADVFFARLKKSRKNQEKTFFLVLFSLLIKSIELHVRRASVLCKKFTHSTTNNQQMWRLVGNWQFEVRICFILSLVVLPRLVHNRNKTVFMSTMKCCWTRKWYAWA